MQAIFETLFNVIYLTSVITLGSIMVKRGKQNSRLFGWMAVLLGMGDAFHLIPRSYALAGQGTEFCPAPPQGGWNKTHVPQSRR